MGLSYGFFWANRDFLALNSTDDGNRNYYYGLESFFNTVAGVVVPGMIGAFLGATADHNWLGGNINLAYKLVTLFVSRLRSSLRPSYSAAGSPIPRRSGSSICASMCCGTR